MQVIPETFWNSIAIVQNQINFAFQLVSRVSLSHILAEVYKLVAYRKLAIQQ